jgi:tRNA1Val (adenine37-N6)-methyltransferase
MNVSPRAPHRPSGWVAPGPAPRGPQWPEAPVAAEDEDLSYLLGDWRIFQKKRGHRWSIDDLVTAWCAVAWGPGAPARHIDLGCGIGTVLMMVAWHYPDVRSIGVEAQEVSHDLATRSIPWNGCEDRVQVARADLREWVAPPEFVGVPLMTGTPPYFDPAASRASQRVQCAPCRIELRGTVYDYCAAAARWLAPTGDFFVCDAALAGDRGYRAAEEAGLQVVRRLDVVPKVGRAPLFRVFHMRRANQGAVATDAEALVSTLVVRDSEDRFTPAYNALKRDMGLPWFGEASRHVLDDGETT